jgi:hypothetical protein
VTLHHAVIRQATTHMITVETVASLPLIVDGRRAMWAEIDIRRGGEIRIGTNRITVTIGDATTDIHLVITHAEAAREEADDASRESEARFSLAGVAPGKRPMAWIAALLILGFFVALPIWSFHRAPAKLTAQQMAGNFVHADASWSVGPLSHAHAALEHDCKACHVNAFVAVPDSACRTCHADTHDHAALDRLAIARAPPGGINGLEQRIAIMFGQTPGRCVECHVEHQGAGAMPPPAQAFCADCHAALKSHLPDTKLADAGDFATSHPQFRPVVMTAPGDAPTFARVSLDADPRENTGLKFPHALHLDARGGAAEMAMTLGRKPLGCADCHVPDESGARFRPVSMERNCQSCHSLAFDRSGGVVRTLRHGEVDQVKADISDFYGVHPVGPPIDTTARTRPGQITLAPFPRGGGAAAAIRAVFSKGGACYDCHVITPPSSPGSLNFGVVLVRQPLRYMAHGWFDHAAHTSETCASCHRAALTSNDTQRLMLPGIATCRNCHGGEAARPPRVRSTCAMCHDYHAGRGAPQAIRAGGKTGRGELIPLRLQWNGYGATGVSAPSEPPAALPAQGP